MDGKPRLIRFICKRMGLILNFHDSSVCLLKNMSTRRFRKVNVICCLTFWSYSESFILFLKSIKKKNVESWSETDRLTDGQKNRKTGRQTDGRRKIVRDQNIISTLVYNRTCGGRDLYIAGSIYYPCVLQRGRQMLHLNENW